MYGRNGFKMGGKSPHKDGRSCLTMCEDKRHCSLYEELLHDPREDAMEKTASLPLCSLVSFSLNDVSAVLPKELETQGLWVTDFAVHLTVRVPNSQQHQISIPIWKQPCQGISKVHLLNTWTSGQSLSRGIRARAQSDSVTSLSRWKDKNGQKTWSQPGLLSCGVGL